jgi:phage antirepressor YoqD-like protein
MNALQHVITIGDIGIGMDRDGRYSLNDLHRAAIANGANPRTKEPGKFLASPQTVDLVKELTDTQNLGIAENQPLTPVNIIKGGAGDQGTFVVKELVYAYAMWISPAFHLKVIRAYDAMMTTPPTIDPMQMLNDPAAMRGLLLTYSEKVLTLEATVKTIQPKADALDRIATVSDGSFCLRDAAKTLQVKEKWLRQFLQERHWIYHRPMGGGWLAYAEKLQRGLMEHKITSGTKADGAEWVDTQARITARGMAHLSKLIEAAKTAA